MKATYQCEQPNCPKRATAEYKMVIDHGDGPETHSTFRCDSHKPSDPRYEATPIATRPGQLHPVFAEALAPYMPAMFDTKPHEFSLCCGSPITDDGRCTSCWEAVVA